MAKQKHPGLTNAEFKELSSYIRFVADKMGLRDWYLRLMHSPPVNDDGSLDEKAAARIEISWGKRHADIYVCKDFKEYSPDRQRQFIVHELVHCHVELLNSLVSEKLRDHVGEMYWQGWSQGWYLAFENAIDAIAYSWAENFPLISWPAK